ncbi:chorismate lyase / 3-hydroxybenzoate synthase [Pseudoxanthomonas sp. GM95]|uniref:chorismate transformation enzyme, FkbO/Hyg5 family n=1 Tax=Pseudoxanthomonas sp. GM95 TaxID=1881043 RepID=UPI0008D38663|nr:pteridine-dependent deoxygenase [Pseudoxanthomonas sp. GM95]SEM39845.1 chorismate lyase / 3-hydroxybenzoate synthase [Pseudoxanthomonas sp. GM95]
MSRPQEAFVDATQLAVDYVPAETLDALLADDHVLAVFGFGPDAPGSDDPRYLRVPLSPYGAAPLEVWRSTRPVVRGRDGAVAWASDGTLQFGAIEIDEVDGDIETAGAQAYALLSQFLPNSATPHLLRVWNYLDGITEGEGDDERYRQFCVGRARGLGQFDATHLPAATGIGRVDGVRTLQVYWLACNRPGTPVENPRQVSAYRYPRQYGPQSPSFARAMLPPAGVHTPLLLSGTAAVVGHQTLHPESTQAQLDETFANFDALIASAHRHAPALPAHFNADSRLKVYVRDADELPLVAALLDARLPAEVPRVLLHATVCRRDLRIEIDGVHGA